MSTTNADSGNGPDDAEPDAPASGDGASATDGGPPERHVERFSTVGALLRQPFRAGFLLTLGGLAAFALGMALTNLSTVVVYIVLALFVALGLDPLVRWLERRGLSRGRAILVVCGLAVLVVAGILLLIVPTVVSQIAEFIRNVPQFVSDFQRSETFAWIERSFGDEVGDMIAGAQDFLLSPSNIAAIGGGVLQVGTSIANGISGIVVVAVLSLYLLGSLTLTKTALLRLAPAHDRDTLSGLADKIMSSVGSYLGGMVILALINSVFVFIMHLALGLPFPQLMAVLAFGVSLIPLVGSIVFWVIGSALALFTSPVAALIFAIAYLIYMQLEAYLLTPRVMGRSISVPPILVLLGTLIGGTLLGLLGALIAIPVTASILLIIKQTVIPRQDAKV